MVLKLLVHVNEPERWSAALAGITNFLNDVGDEHAAVIVVSNGAGVKGFLKGNLPPPTLQGEACSIRTGADIPAMDLLSRRGVAFLACKHALNAQDIHIEQLHFFVNVISAGMTEMVRLQTEGFAYIKP